MKKPFEHEIIKKGISKHELDGKSKVGTIFHHRGEYAR